MSFLYKNEEERTTFVESEVDNGTIQLTFSKDCGKFGTDEVLDFYNLTPERLLEILQDRNDYEDHELEK